MTCNQIVAVYISGTSTPIRDATVTCTGHTPKPTNRYGITMFAVEEGATHNIRANADGYVISDAHTIIGCQDTLTIELEEEEQIQITVKRPTWVSMAIHRRRGMANRYGRWRDHNREVPSGCYWYWVNVRVKVDTYGIQTRRLQHNSRL
jgi:hypothetical protein